ncbi:uncharacterized protein LOC108933039 [Scleropages formosus]|uniref:uncharacterized protein LOC108933039 n=1 Tax=Scleropages formosus TaxID=113540 RepID=UPI0010FAB581|nr:uncharacterized protein LOC108933039 [Scleropages formosus]
MADIHSLLFSALDDLERDDLKRFKMYLQQGVAEGLGRIPKGQLEDKGVTDVVEKMVVSFGREEALRVTLLILKKINQNDLAQQLEKEYEKQISEQQRDMRRAEAENQIEEHIQKLEQEIAELRRRNSELEQLPLGEDFVSPTQSSPTQFPSSAEEDTSNKPNQATKPKELLKKDVVKLEDKLRRERLSLKELKERRQQKSQDSTQELNSKCCDVKKPQPQPRSPQTCDKSDLPSSVLVSSSSSPCSTAYKEPEPLIQCNTSPTGFVPQNPTQPTYPSGSPGRFTANNPTESFSPTSSTRESSMNKNPAGPSFVSSSVFRSSTTSNPRSKFPLSYTSHSTFVSSTIQKTADPVSFSRSLPRSTAMPSTGSQLRNVPHFSLEEALDYTSSTPQFMPKTATLAAVQQDLLRSRPGDLLNMPGMFTGPSGVLGSPQLTAGTHLMNSNVIRDISALHLGVPRSTGKRLSLPDINTFGL